MKNMEVKLAPIQRNINDVAIELTELYYSQYKFNSIDELSDTYSKFYSMVSILGVCGTEKMKNYLPEMFKKQ